MILDIITPEVASTGTRTEKLKWATGFLSVAAANAWAAIDLLQPGRTVGQTVFGVLSTTAMSATTYSGTYTLLSAMEPDPPQPS